MTMTWMLRHGRVVRAFVRSRLAVPYPPHLLPIRFRIRPTLLAAASAAGTTAKAESAKVVRTVSIIDQAVMSRLPSHTLISCRYSSKYLFAFLSQTST